VNKSAFEEWADARAQDIAHSLSTSCRNRPSHYTGHGKACIKMAKVIRAVMEEAAQVALKTDTGETG